MTTLQSQKAFKGVGMEGFVARWYTKTRSNDMDDFGRRASAVAAQLAPGSDVLEVAPGPGFFAVELARKGEFNVTGLDVSHTFVEIAAANAARAGVEIGFRQGDAAAMPFAAASFDFIYCSAAFKNFSQPLLALNEMHRVLRPGGRALIEDLRSDVSLGDIDRYVEGSGRSTLDAWLTKWTFRHVLLKRALTRNGFERLVECSNFGACRIESDAIGMCVWMNRRY